MAVGIQDWHWAALGAVTAGLVSVLAASASIRLRGWIYGGAKSRPAAVSFELPVLPTAVRSATEVREDEALVGLLRIHHERSRSLQDSAAANLVAASATLCVAFISLAAGTTVLRSSSGFHIYTAGLDVAALAVVIWTFIRSAHLRRAWVRERTLAEFIRQWRDSDFLLTRRQGEITKPYDAFVDRTRAALEARDIGRAALAFGRTRLAEIRTEIAAATPISKERFRFYLQRRPVYQAEWFARSAKRIEGRTELRGRIMAGLFGLALLAATVELSASLAHAEIVADAATLLLAAAIGLGTAATSSYFGQNLRGLHHRYAQQECAIERWFADYADVTGLADCAARLGPNDMERLAIAAADFEALMLFELLDWISITQRDTMELGPI